MANCASTLDHYGTLEVDYDGYRNTTNTLEEYHTFEDTTDDSTGDGQVILGNLPHGGVILVNNGVVVRRENDVWVIKNGVTLATNGVIVHRTTHTTDDNITNVNLVVEGNIVVKNLIVVNNIVNFHNQFQIIVNVIVWVVNNNGDITSFGDYHFVLVDGYTAPRVAGCYDTYAADCATGSRPFTCAEDVLDLRNDFTIALRFKPIFTSPPSNANVTFLSYRETTSPSTRFGVRLHGAISSYSGTYKIKMDAATTPADISPSSVGISARVGREYESGTCLTAFIRWNQTSKILTLNVLRPGDVGGTDTNDETTWDVTYGDYILSEGSSKLFQVQGEDTPFALFYWDRVAIWNHRLADGEVRYDFVY
jgi:hypothetical protein